MVILSAGLTPAWQQILLVDTLLPGSVNRARAASWCASGKVLNAARALHHLGGPCKALTVVGGATGAQIRADCAQLGLAARWIEVALPTRVCTTLLDTTQHTTTELVPNAEAISAAERQAFLDAYAEEAAATAVVVLIGSLPAGTPPDFYLQLLGRTPGKAVLDARGAELLAALDGQPFLVKPNREELQQTLGRPLNSDEDLFAALEEIRERGARWVVVTSGREPVHISGEGRLYRVRPPVQLAVNPIGCGDCLAAGIAWALFQQREPLDAILYGVAAAVDKVGQLLPGVVDRQRVEALANSLTLERL